MKKMCIFNAKKVCDDCGECYTCCLNPKKKCDNCGKCLELEGYDTKAIKIDEIIGSTAEHQNEADDIQDLEDEEDYEDDGESETYNPENDSERNDNNTSDSDNDNVEFIDDVKGLRDIMENKKTFEKNFTEEYPGLIVLHRGKKSSSDK